MTNSKNPNDANHSGLASLSKAAICVALVSFAALFGCSNSKEATIEKAALRVAKAFYDHNPKEMKQCFEKKAIPYVDEFCSLFESRSLNYEPVSEGYLKQSQTTFTDNIAQIPIWVIFEDDDGELEKEIVVIHLVKQDSKWVGAWKMIDEVSQRLTKEAEMKQRLDEAMESFKRINCEE